MVTLAENVASGRGLYTSKEAAFYARMPSVTMNRWIQGSRNGERVIRPEIWGEQDKYLTFMDFVQALAIRTFRLTYDIPLQKIRSAVNNAADRYGVEHPFARNHVTYWDGKDIHIELTDGLLTQVTGKSLGQGSFKQLVEVYLRDLTFDVDGIAATYRAYTWKDTEIRMNPKIRFGEPIIMSCGYTAQSLWQACITEGSIEAGSKAYGVAVNEAEAAYRYYDFLQGKAA